MAGKWRIRHKLMLSMGLMVSVLALLLVGTLKGLASYRATMRTIGSKMDELEEADNLRAAVKELAKPPLQYDDITKKIDVALVAKAAIQDQAPGARRCRPRLRLRLRGTRAAGSARQGVRRS